MTSKNQNQPEQKKYFCHQILLLKARRTKQNTQVKLPLKIKSIDTILTFLMAEIIINNNFCSLHRNLASTLFLPNKGQKNKGNELS